MKEPYKFVHVGVYHEIICGNCEHEWYEDDETFDDIIMFCPKCHEKLTMMEDE